MSPLKKDCFRVREGRDISHGAKAKKASQESPAFGNERVSNRPLASAGKYGIKKFSFFCGILSFLFLYFF